MERKKISNSLFIIVTLAIIAVVIITKTVMVLNDRHEEKLIYAMHSKVEYNALKCYREEKCKDTITLQVLYDNEYIKDEIIDPITKEVISHDLEIKYENDKIVINWK
jgi:hypothetical protein